MPEIYATRNPVEMIVSVLDDLANESSSEVLDEKTHRTLAYLACRSALKAGDQLNAKQRRELVTALLKTQTRYTCPHGRPTHIELSLSEFDKMFKRI